MKFYELCGNEIDRSEFIKKYGTSYYIDQPRYIPRVGQSSQTVEDIIDSLLKNGIKEPLDVVHILAWKLGKIRHHESNDGFVYAKDWEKAEEFNITRYGRAFNIEYISNYIANNIENLEVKSETNPQGVLEELKDQNIDGIGTVYLLTLLYFISRGKYPIYDRFALAAVKAICDDKKPGEIITVPDLPDKKSRDFKNVFDKHMVPFMEKLEDAFGSLYRENRNVDRALWVYGHAFHINK